MAVSKAVMASAGRLRASRLRPSFSKTRGLRGEMRVACFEEGEGVGGVLLGEVEDGEVEEGLGVFHGLGGLVGEGADVGGAGEVGVLELLFGEAEVVLGADGFPWV